VYELLCRASIRILVADEGRGRRGAGLCLAGEAPSQKSDVVGDGADGAEAVAPGAGDEQRGDQDQGQEDELPVGADEGEERRRGFVADGGRVAKDQGAHHGGPRQGSLEDLEQPCVLPRQLSTRSPELCEDLLGSAEGTDMAAVRRLAGQNDGRQEGCEENAPVNAVLPSRPVPYQ